MTTKISAEGVGGSTAVGASTRAREATLRSVHVEYGPIFSKRPMMDGDSDGGVGWLIEECLHYGNHSARSVSLGALQALEAAAGVVVVLADGAH